MLKRIPVAIDCADLPNKAVRDAIELALLSHGKLHVLSVVPRYSSTYLESAKVHSSAKILRIECERVDSARPLQERLVSRAPATWLSRLSRLVPLT